MGAIRLRTTDLQSRAMSERFVRHVVVLAGLATALAATPTSAASPDPLGWTSALHEQALDAIRAADPRFEGLPDFADVLESAQRDLDFSGLITTSWMQVLPTFNDVLGRDLAVAPGTSAWTDIGLGSIVEVMLVSDCERPSEARPPTVEPCGWRHTWLYRVQPDGEAVLLAEAGSPDTGAP